VAPALPRSVLYVSRLLAYSTPFAMPSSFIIDDFGSRIATVWSELRPATRGLVERALSGTQASRNFQYDARADLEISRFLDALDDRAAEKTDLLDPEKGNQLKSIADTCAAVLLEKTESAEVFTQLVRRAQMRKDYKRIDTPMRSARVSRQARFASWHVRRMWSFVSSRTKHSRVVQFWCWQVC